MDTTRTTARLDDHEERLRALERAFATVERLEEKIDQLVEAGHGEALARLLEREEARDERFDELRREHRDDIAELADRLDDIEEKSADARDTLARVTGGVLVLLWLAQSLMGMDLSSVDRDDLPEVPAAEERLEEE